MGVPAPKPAARSSGEQACLDSPTPRSGEGPRGVWAADKGPQGRRAGRGPWGSPTPGDGGPAGLVLRNHPQAHSAGTRCALNGSC